MVQLRIGNRLGRRCVGDFGFSHGPVKVAGGVGGGAAGGQGADRDSRYENSGDHWDAPKFA